jgi:transcriptional regulator with XRE-family HTH domain
MDKHTALAKRRKALGLSQVELAQMLGMTQASVSRNETADKPDMRFVLALEAIELKSAKPRRRVAA